MTMWSVLSLLSLGGSLVRAQETGVNPGWPRWCGKVYKPEYPSFDPGGQMKPPPEIAGPPQLHLQFAPRYSLYLDNEARAEFVIRAELSRYFGVPLDPALPPPGAGQALGFSITLNSTGEELAAGSVAVNSTRNVVGFDLAPLSASLSAQLVVLRAWIAGQERVYTATAELWYLPDKRSGSVTRIDNLNGGLMFRNTASNHTFRPLLPYGFYASYDGFLGEHDMALIQRYADFGLNSMTPLTTYPASRDAFEYMEKIDLPFMYNLRDGYQNLTYVEEKVRPAIDSEAIYSYWSADEPDGWQHPFNQTVLARDLIRRLDPYHPVAVTLNCQDYYFGEYSAGADFIMEDVYPIIVNATFSKWGTECNKTYGDCGCDNCAGNVRDVSSRLDDLARYGTWLGRWPTKTKAHNPQSFHGEGYWHRDPTPREAVVMNVLAFNHGAQAIVSWVWPPTDLLATTHGGLSKVVTAPPVVDFLVGGGDGPHKIVVDGLGDERIDVAYWRMGGKLLVSVANPSDAEDRMDLSFGLPVAAAGIEAVPVGGGGLWALQDGGNTLRAAGNFSAMSASMLILSLA